MKRKDRTARTVEEGGKVKTKGKKKKNDEQDLDALLAEVERDEATNAGLPEGNQSEGEGEDVPF